MELIFSEIFYIIQRKMTQLRSRRLTAFVLLTFFVSVNNAWMDERPVLEVRDGNLFITSARDKNITIKTHGDISYVNINGINLLQEAKSAQSASQLVEQWKLGRLAQFESTLSRLTETIEGRSGVLNRLLNLEFGDSSNTTSPSRPARFPNRGSVIDTIARNRVQRLTVKVNALQRSIANLRTKIEADECVSNPCHNGGTCEDLIDGYKCRCTEGWEGPQCKTDANECVRYAGTDLGCQNGATCVNLPGTYQCICANNWYGLHCTSSTKDCNGPNSHELCGYGTCVNKKSSVLGYTCICEQGWESNGVDPVCNVDVDECSGNRPPCSVNPLVPCINVPGTFYCGGCPQGYTGTGYYCADIDECAINNGGCSINPSVQCMNTMGSRVCGNCPPGYQGDGVTCSYLGTCNINNGGCHPLATCLTGPGISDWIVQCRCPAGYTGDGLGPNGCVIDRTPAQSPCNSNPCIHGTCIPRGSFHYTCRCEPGYEGSLCATQTHPCDPNPCKNGGTCSLSPSRTAICTCAAGFSGSKCGKHRSSCGSVIREPSGSLQFPTAGSYYPNGLSCAWVLVTNSSKVLNVTFTAFNLEQSNDCQWDFLQVHDGSGAGEHMIGRYCGTQLPHGGNIISSESSLYLWFHSDNSVSSDGFTIQWNSVDPLCGGELTGEHGALSSPGSPGKYPKDRDCAWQIRVTPGKRIRFTFFPLMLEESPGCTKDYLEIREGRSSSNPQLGLYCNHTHPAPLTTSAEEAWVHFHSDSSGQDHGFQINYSIDHTPGCGGVYTATSGRITSPDYHNERYGERLDCDWRIQIPTGERIQIMWLDFDLERSRSCRFDFVEVYDGANREAPLLGRYCDHATPPTILSTSNTLLVRFRSDWTLGGKGFHLKYEVWCGGEFTDPTGVIKSPYYPEPYPASRTCIYKVIQPPGKSIQLTIQDMDIEGRDFPDCYFDYLEIRDGDTENSTSLGTFCGTNSSIPEFPILSTHNYMWLKFDTDYSIHKRGFLATYTTIDRGCGGILKAVSGIIQPPSEDGLYSNEQDCTWLISAPPGFVIQLNWLSFELESHESCRFDYIKISENITSDLQQDMGTFCGSTKPPIMTSQSQIMSIHFHTDDSVRKDGFMASYIFIDASKTCGGYFSSATGVITTPNYPEPYPASKVCEWIINAPNRHQVVINVKKFDLESHSSCLFDSLEIRTGGTNTSPLLGKFCGTDIPSQLKSFGSQMYLKFQSDSSRHHEGFEIEWDSTTIGCGGTLTTTTGAVSSPNYPQPYTHRAECNWRISVSAGSYIVFTFLDLDLENHDNCLYDYLEIYDGDISQGHSLGKFCGTQHPAVVKTSSNYAFIRFQSDWTGAGRGFHMNYLASCQNTLRGYRGVIESPNFPNNYPNRANCSWIIEAPLGNKLNITFSHFDLEGGSENTCLYDYVTIREGDHNTPNKEVNTYCDSTEIPPKIVSNQRQVFVRFVTDSFTVHNGFRLEWVVNGCGGILRQSEGTITSPGYPNPYSAEVDCEWQIVVDYLHSIEVTFVDVKLEKSAGCGFDNVTLYNGPDARAPKLIGLCHLDNKQPSVFTSTGNQMFFQFHADFSYQNKGFKATYRSVNITCGGKFTTPTGIIHSANYPINYPKNQYCEWLIEVPENHLVNLTFTDFDIEDTSDCTDDYVRVYDGLSSETPLLGYHCGNTLPPSYVSTSNQMMVLMRTDPYVSAKGFKASFDMACGAKIYTNDQGIISMHSLTGLHTDRVNCTWTIIAEQLDDHVTLTFTDMRITDSSYENGDCFAGSVQVFEGESTAGPSIGTWCNTTVPPAIISRGNALTIHAASLYGYLYDVRFAATYSVLNSACGGNYTSEYGRISTPGYPDNYPRNVECVWNIQIAPGNSISLSFADFDLIESPNCDLDYVEVREENGAGNLKGIYCGSNPKTLTSSKNLWIKFKSSADGTKKGFLADYTLNHGNDLSGPSGEVASPLYPQPCTLDGEYYWRIVVDITASIQITFKDFQIESYYDDCSVSLTIYDGYNNEAPELFSKCGMTLPETVRSSSNVIYIKFSSTQLRQGSWFLLSWLQVPRESIEGSGVTSAGACDEIISLTGPDNSSYVLSSPGWPNGYEQNLDCSWTFESVPGTHLILNFEHLNVEESSECLMDYVKVHTGSPLVSQQRWTEIGSYCRSNGTSESIETSNLMKVDFHTDWSNNRTGFSARIRKVCGGQLLRPNGIIEFNGTTHTDRTGALSSIECQWNVTVKQGRMIEVRFIEMDIQSTAAPTCSDNFLLLKNGGSSSSPLLGQGKYCHDEIPATLQTTGNQLYVKTSGLKSKIRFKLTYREVGITCGSDIVLTESLKIWEISSPNYPNIPSPHTECFWTVMAPAGQDIMINFIDRFDLTSSANCDREYLEIRDGGTDLSSLIGRYCGTNAPSTFTTTGNMMYIHFYTDVNEPKNGFKARLSIGECGGIIRGFSGSFKSPNYPLAYSTNVTCAWYVVGPPGHTVKLQFQDINLPSYSTCENGDHVEITEKFPYNGTRVTSRLSTARDVRVIGQYCGDDNPGVIETSGNKALITFKSSAVPASSDRGFIMNFTTSVEKCGGPLEGMAGEFSSPGYPNIGANHNRLCEWTINVPEGYRIQIDIQDIDLGEPTTPGKSPPLLRFYNDAGWKSLIKAYRASDTERQIMSTSSVMYIWYWASTTSHRGFKARYSRVVPALCGSAVTDNNGTLTSRQSSLFYLHTFNCRWQLTSPAVYSNGQTLTITVSGLVGNVSGPMTVEACLQKPANILLLSEDSRTVGCITGNLTREVTLRSPLPINTIVALRSMWGHPIVNYTLNYRWHSCGGLLSGSSHTVTAPRNIPYPVDCVWYAKFTDNGVAVLTFKRMNLATSSGDYILVRNGGPASPQIGTYRGSIIPPIITGQTSNLWIEYHAQDPSSDFEFEVKSRQGGCGGMIHGLHSSEIFSPAFPKQYPNNAECEWEIVVENAYHIGLVFVDRFNLETSTGCSNDFVQVFDWRENITTGRRSWYDMGKVCGRIIPQTFNSTSNRMKILFRSNDNIGGDGFHARWSTNCGAVLNVLKRPQWMATPGWPVKYRGNLNCNYTFLAPGNKRFIAEFKMFDLESGANCKYDNVSISGERYSATSVYCGYDMPPLQRVQSRLELIFRTDAFIERRGFKIRYLLDECGDVITQPSVINSPSESGTGNYYTRINCTWIVRAPPGKAVVLKLEKFHLEHSQQCYFDYFAVYSTTIIDSKSRLALLCGAISNSMPILRSESGSMLINFVTDYSNNYGGFSANIVFTSGVAEGCGGNINLTQSQTFRTQRGATYESLEDCHWLVRVPSSNMVKLQITSMDLKNSTSLVTGNPSGSCSGDYLEIRDGAGPLSELIGRYCGNVIPPVITSSSNAMWIRFVSDGTMNGNGVVATLDKLPSPCGDSILEVGNQAKELTSPGYPAAYQSGLRCRWALNIAETNRVNKITIHFVDFNLEDSANCTEDVLSITDKNNKNYISEGFGEDFIFSGTAQRPQRTWMGSHITQGTYSYCGSAMPHDYYSTGSELEIQFRTYSQQGQSQRKFKLEYSRSGCGRNFTAIQGRVLHEDANECWLTITVPVGRTISLYFSEFVSFDHGECVNSFLVVHEGGFNGSTLARLCGSTNPNPIFSSGNKLSLYSRMRSPSFTNQVYDITYTSTDKGRGCGGKIYNYAGVFTSPLYPGPYRNSSLCSWEIAVPVGYKVKLEFKTFDLGLRETCDTDSLEVVDLLPNGNTLATSRYCGEDHPATYQSNTDKVMVNYRTSVNNGGTGWVIDFEAKRQE